MNVCNKCIGISGWIILILGILFLLADLGIWGFFGINWWTALLIVWGICALFSKGCPDCQALRNPKKK